MSSIFYSEDSMSVQQARTKQVTTAFQMMDRGAMALGVLLLDQALRLIRP
jgi:hypothetical protein